MDAAHRLHAAKADTARRLVAQLRGGPPDWADTPVLNDAAVYTDPARHAEEQRVLFRNTPLVACLSRDLPQPGSFRLFDETGLPIVIVRTATGGVRGFINICPHRGARLVQQTEGTARRFTCHFHGWTCTNEGEVVGVPQKAGFEGCLDGRGLTEVPAAERHGLVFVQASPGTATDVDALLGDVAPELAMLELDQAERVKTAILPVASNWKYALDTYGEGYHFATLHRDTIAPYFKADAQVYNAFGPHHRVTWAAVPMLDWMQQPATAWDVDSLVGWVHYIFPNTILFLGAVQPGRSYVTLFRHFPGATPGETLTYKTVYAPHGVTSDEQRAEIEAAFDATAFVVTTEDYPMAAEGWKNLAAQPHKRTVVYGRQEIAVQHFHEAISAAIAFPAPRIVAAARHAA